MRVLGLEAIHSAASEKRIGEATPDFLSPSEKGTSLTPDPVEGSDTEYLAPYAIELIFMAKVSPRKQWSGRLGSYPASISLRHIAKAGALALTSKPSALQRSDLTN